MSIENLMGKIVLVDRVFKRTYLGEDSRNRYKKAWKDCSAEGRPGWVVGERWIQNGANCYAYGDEPVDWEREGPTVHCFLVVYWPTMRAVRVPLDGYRLAPSTVLPYPPVQPGWLEEQRKYLRDLMSNWPRDSKRRWVKKGDQNAKA